MNNDILKSNQRAKNYINNYLLEESEKHEIKVKPWMNLITWYWWSWKTRFIEEVLNEASSIVSRHWKKLIHIQFNPRDFQSTDNIYQHFFETFINSILKEKYNWNLKSSINILLDLLDNSWSNYLKLISKIIHKETLSINDMIEKINKILVTMYKEYIIIVVVDEIDRLEQFDLVNVWKILNLISKLTEKQKIMEEDKNLTCLYSVDLKYLSWFSFWDNWKTSTDFYQYYNKFRNTEYDVYNSSKYDLIQYIFENIKEISYFNFSYIEGISNIQALMASCQSLFLKLEELEIPIVVRDAIYLFDNLKISLEQIWKSLESYFSRTIYSNIFDKKNINYYLTSWGKNNQYIFLYYVYIKSIHQKDFQIINDLDRIYNIYNSYVFSLYEDEKNKQIITDAVNNFIDRYKFKFSEVNFNFENFIKFDYPLIRALISKDNIESRTTAIINEYEKDIIYELCTQNFYKIDNIDNLEKILFLTKESGIFSSRNHFTEIYNIVLNNIKYKAEGKFKFFQNSLEIFKGYISDLNTHSWEEIDNFDTWFIITVLTFLHMFIKDVQFVIFNNNWTPKVNQEDNINTIIDWIIRILQVSDELFKRWTKFRFFYIYFYLRLCRYWIYTYEQKRNKNLKYLISKIFQKVDNSDINQDEYIWDLSQDIRLFEFRKFESELKHVKNNLVKFIKDFLDEIWCNWDKIVELLKICETIIYSLFYSKQTDNKEYDDINSFLNTYIKDKKYKFLLLCNWLVYNFAYEWKSSFRNDFPLLNETYKNIYKELDKNWEINILFDMYYDDVSIYYEDENHYTKNWKLKKLVESKELQPKSLTKKTILNIMDRFYKNDSDIL